LKQITKKKHVEKRSVGRPALYRSRFAEQAEKLCQLGAIDKELADFFNVSMVTIWKWQSRHPEFFAALRRGKATANERVERALYSMATGYSYDSEKLFLHGGKVIRAPTIEHVPPSDTACIFWLKNRDPKRWRDKVELTGNATIDLSKKPETIEEAQAQYREILNATPEVLAESIKLMMIEHKPEEEEA
jgi:hypothetical protein